VIGVPLDGGALGGADALYAIVQMPPGVPVAAVAIGSAGAKNAGHLAARVLALGDPAVAGRVQTFRDEQAAGAEIAIECGICHGTGCRSCGNEGYLEVGGAGMVHREIIENAGYDADRYTGFAAGFGVERIAMLRHNIDDIRYFYSNDLRFLRQF